MTIRSPVTTAPESSAASPLTTSRVPCTRPATATPPLRTATSPRHSLPRGSRDRPTNRVVVGALYSRTASSATRRGSVGCSAVTLALSGLMTIAVSWAASRVGPRRQKRARRAFDRISGSSLHVAGWLEAQPPHPAVQVGAVGGEPAGRLGHVAARRREGARDQRPLEVVERIRERHIGPRFGLAGASAVLGNDVCHVVGGDRLVVPPAPLDPSTPRGEDRQALDDVRQLAHVAGPRA